MNEITFKVDRTFSREFGVEKGFAVALDLTGDKTNAQPPIALFTLKGGDMMQSYIKGVKHPLAPHNSDIMKNKSF